MDAREREGAYARAGLDRETRGALRAACRRAHGEADPRALLELAEWHLEAGRRCAGRRPVEALARAVWARELVRMAVVGGLGGAEGWPG